jgi:DNA-binding CsgD family transcriptional regulator
VIRVAVSVNHGASAIELRVANGPGEPAEDTRNGQRPGHGLAGMRERVAMLDGSLSAGPTPGGGFVVSAVLPLAEAAERQAVTRRLIADFARQPRADPPVTATLGSLTHRETEVLRLIARGLSNAEISETLVIAEQTTKTHVGRILAKLGLRDRAQAVVLAYESGLITPGG